MENTETTPFDVADHLRTPEEIFEVALFGYFAFSG
jgi:hypothetical protein